uniref:Tetratricopeptide repeat protein 33 n=1 Tax=Kalanchoe fedtschenkoi TaxID=63787 RepID=A0A7N0TPL6_KALFE
MTSKMKLTWTKKPSTCNKKRIRNPLSHFSDLPFDSRNQTGADTCGGGAERDAADKLRESSSANELSSFLKLSDDFQAQGNKLAEDGKYYEALAKWETALNLTPEKAILHEQKAQVLLEIGDAWKALKAATRATELDPSWAEAWITLGRTQLNFGEPDNAIQSFNRALVIKPDSLEAQEGKRTASHLIQKRKQLHASGLITREDRFVVGDKFEE